MSKEMLINTVEGKECRIAIVEDGVLEELYIERQSSVSRVGNVYKGKVTNVEPSIQAAFVDFGFPKNGFLHISDINPMYFPKGHKSGAEAVGKKRAHHDRPPIQECLRRGQEVIAQITKEGIGTKGPTLTTYLSIPGRLLVMMPGMSRLGVSRKIEDEAQRDKARRILAELKTPSDIGFIVRTAAMDRSKKDFLRDLNYLLRLWRSIKQQIKTAKAPAEIYQESDLVTRTIRDVYNTDIDRIICDSQPVARKVKEFLDVALPRTPNVIELYAGKEGLFHDYGLEQEIEKIYSRRVELPSGGSLVIDQTEAMVAIDVNSGRFREHRDAETTATKINLEAAKEIARQLRLRDLGGEIVIDFIDMREDRNSHAVERTLREEVKRDRAKTKILKMSSFGIVEMTRQRIRPSLKSSIYRTCTYCEGSGLVKSEESQSLLVMRDLQRATSNDEVAAIEVVVTPSAAHHLLNFQRRQLANLETATGKTVVIRADASLPGDTITITCTNSRGATVPWQQAQAAAGLSRKVETININRLPAGPTTTKALPIELEAQEEGQVTAESADELERIEAGELVEATEMAKGERASSPIPPRPHVEPAPVPGQRAPTAPAPAPRAPAPQAQLAQAQPSGPGQKRRRRGRRGGRKHRRQREKAQMQAQGQPPGTPPQAGRTPQAQPAAGQAASPRPPQPYPKPQPHPPSPTTPVAAETRTQRHPDRGRIDEPVSGKAAPAAMEAAKQPQDQAAKAGKKRHRGHRGGRKHKKKGPQFPPAAPGMRQGPASAGPGQAFASSAPPETQTPGPFEAPHPVGQAQAPEAPSESAAAPRPAQRPQAFAEPAVPPVPPVPAAPAEATGQAPAARPAAPAEGPAQPPAALPAPAPAKKPAGRARRGGSRPKKVPKSLAVEDSDLPLSRDERPIPKSEIPDLLDDDE